MQVSYDGGKTFVRMNESEKHVDNHAVAFKMSDKNYEFNTQNNVWLLE